MRSTYTRLHLNLRAGWPHGLPATRALLSAAAKSPGVAALVAVLRDADGGGGAAHHQGVAVMALVAKHLPSQLQRLSLMADDDGRRMHLLPVVRLSCV